MLSWSQQRKLLLFWWIFLFIAIILGVYGWRAFHSPPDCFNDSKDGNERGTDCGGSCARICPADARALIVHFARALEVKTGVWGAVAYVENRNTGAGARSVPYVFKLYDEENLLLYERHGSAFIPPRKVFSVFEGKMLSGERIPARATFEFLEKPTFERMNEPELVLVTKEFSADGNGSTLEATLTNPTQGTIKNIDVVALLFGPDGNVTGASATFVAILLPERSAKLTFTWPQVLERPARTEILYAVAANR